MPKTPVVRHGLASSSPLPGCLRVIAQINPLTYLIDALRGLVIMGGESINGYGVDFAVMLVVFAALLCVAVRLYPTLAE